MKLLGRDLVMQNLAGCGVKLGLYSKYTGMPLSAAMHGSIGYGLHLTKQHLIDE